MTWAPPLRKVYFNEKQGGWILRFYKRPFVTYVKLDPVAAHRGRQIDTKEDAHRVARTIPTPPHLKSSGGGSGQVPAGVGASTHTPSRRKRASRRSG